MNSTNLLILYGNGRTDLVYSVCKKNCKKNYLITPKLLLMKLRFLKFQQSVKKLYVIYLAGDAPFAATFVVRRIEKDISHCD